jgi:hypothetical protein
MSAPVHTMPIEIIKAIVAVTGKVKKLGKEGNNTFQRYKFTSVDQFYEALGPLMASEGLCDMAFEKSVTVEVRETANDQGVVKKGAWLIAEYDFVLYHESGVCSPAISRTIQVQASGAQSYASAQSYAEKYFLRNLFKVPTGDVDEVDQAVQEGLPPGNVVNLRKDKKITATQVSMIQTALRTLVDKDVEAAMLAGVSQKVGSPVEKLSDIPAEYVAALMGTLAAKMDAQAKASEPRSAEGEDADRLGGGGDGRI